MKDNKMKQRPKRVAPETAQKHDFYKRNGERNRETIEAENKTMERKEKEKKTRKHINNQINHKKNKKHTKKKETEHSENKNFCFVSASVVFFVLGRFFFVPVLFYLSRLSVCFLSRMSFFLYDSRLLMVSRSRLFLSRDIYFVFVNVVRSEYVRKKHLHTPRIGTCNARCAVSLV